PRRSRPPPALLFSTTAPGPRPARSAPPGPPPASPPQVLFPNARARAMVRLRMKKRYVVIMAGGRGERFWPQSRLSRPKQLLPIVGDKPLLTQTVERLGDVAPREHVFV